MKRVVGVDGLWRVGDNVYRSMVQPSKSVVNRFPSYFHRFMC